MCELTQTKTLSFMTKAKTQYGYFKIGWELCSDCYNREVNFEHDKQEQKKYKNKRKVILLFKFIFFQEKFAPNRISSMKGFITLSYIVLNNITLWV